MKPTDFCIFIIFSLADIIFQYTLGVILERVNQNNAAVILQLIKYIVTT